MSQWTHVAGVVRFDGIAGMMPEPVLGNTVSYEDPERKWSECNVPMGSEGSLSHNMVTSSRDSDLARWVATIWGDLRDYDNADEIIEYFKRIVNGQMIRSGVFKIDVEGSPTRVFFYDGEKEKWVEAGQELD